LHAAVLILRRTGKQEAHRHEAGDRGAEQQQVGGGASRPRQYPSRVSTDDQYLTAQRDAPQRSTSTPTGRTLTPTCPNRPRVRSGSSCSSIRLSPGQRPKRLIMRPVPHDYAVPEVKAHTSRYHGRGHLPSPLQSLS